MTVDEIIKRYHQWARNNDMDKVSVSNQLEKLEEEIGEVRKAIIDGNKGNIMGELGDVMFANLGLMIKMNVFPIECMFQSLQKIEDRVYHVVDNQLVKESDL